MTCRCTNQWEHDERERRRKKRLDDDRVTIWKERAEELEQTIQNMSAKPEHYKILKLRRVNEHLVLKVQYPNCRKCSYDGAKVMVFLNVPEHKTILWRRIDPHFLDNKHAPTDASDAPSPAARFPATPQGWDDAVEYAQRKVTPTLR